MKKKNEQWLRYSNRALSGLLMLFGFVSCDNGGGDIPVEYGMPSAKYRVKGKVIDADTQEPVPGIEVVTGAVHTGDGKEWLSYPDTLITDKMELLLLKGRSFHLKNIVLSFAMWMVMPMVLILRIVSR
jgi:putative lipoprotein (rSAM/lipoprotein system)